MTIALYLAGMAFGLWQLDAVIHEIQAKRLPAVLGVVGIASALVIISLCAGHLLSDFIK